MHHKYVKIDFLQNKFQSSNEIHGKIFHNTGSIGSRIPRVTRILQHGKITGSPFQRRGSCGPWGVGFKQTNGQMREKIHLGKCPTRKGFLLVEAFGLTFALEIQQSISGEVPAVSKNNSNQQRATSNASFFST